MQALLVSALYVGGVTGHQDDWDLGWGGNPVGPQSGPVRPTPVGPGHPAGPGWGGHPVGPQPGPVRPTPVGPVRPTPVGPVRPTPVGPVRPTPVGPVRPTPVGPVRPTPVGNPRGCPRFGAPRSNSYCRNPGLECQYSRSKFQCSDDWEWIRMPHETSCYKDGHTYRDGFKFINSQGCVEWSCEEGNVDENDCPPPPSGCFKNGVTYPNHFQPPPDAEGCVEWQCEDGKIRYNPCPVHEDGCWRHEFYYHDGYTEHTNDARHCPLWKCVDGHIEYLGACPDQNGCMKGGIEYADGFTKYRNGCGMWTCSNGQIYKLVPKGPKCEAQMCAYKGNDHPVGARVENFRSRKFDCATALCQESDNGRAKWQCLLG